MSVATQTVSRVGIVRAKAVAGRLVEILGPACEEIHVAGSVRREVAWVKDIEIVLVPKFGKQPKGLFEFSDVSLATTALNHLVNGGQMQRRLDANDRTCWGDRHQRAVFEGVPIDIFQVMAPAQLGVILAIRTGCAAFSKAIVSAQAVGGRLPRGMYVKDGALWRANDLAGPDQLIPTPTEASFFRAINWPDYPSPVNRTEEYGWH